MRRSMLLRAVLAGTALLVAAAAEADVKVGVTAAVNPQAIGQPPTEPERVLMVGTDNFANEKITTGPAGQLQLLFVDGSSISVGPEANLTIDQYVYDPNTKKGKLAVSAAQGSVALRTKLRWRGAVTMASSANTRYSQATTSTEPPRLAATRSSVAGPPRHLGKKQATTRSPTRHLVTPLPTSATSPAPSDSITRSCFFWREP